MQQCSIWKNKHLYIDLLIKVYHQDPTSPIKKAIKKKFQCTSRKRQVIVKTLLGLPYTSLGVKHINYQLTSSSPSSSHAGEASSSEGRRCQYTDSLIATSWPRQQTQSWSAPYSWSEPRLLQLHSRGPDARTASCLFRAVRRAPELQENSHRCEWWWPLSHRPGRPVW